MLVLIEGSLWIGRVQITLEWSLHQYCPGLKILNLQTQGKTSTENLEMDNNPFSINGFGTSFEHLYWLKMCVSEQSIVMYWRKVDDVDHLIVNDSEIVRDEIVFLACNSCERTDLELVKRRCHI